MPRPITAGARPASDQADVIAHVFLCLADLWYLGRRRRALVERIARLNRWATAAYAWCVRHKGHPEHAARRQRLASAEARLCARRGALHGLDGEAASLRSSLAKHLDRLHPKRRAALLAGDGWPQAETTEGIVVTLWREAQAFTPMPEGEAPF